MKKILVIVPVILFITAAVAQDPDMNKKMPTTNSLDGRAFKITLTASTSKNNMRSDQKEMSTVPDQSSGGVNNKNGRTDNPDQSYDSGNKNDKESMNKNDKGSMNDMHNKSGIIRFENGFIKTSMMNQKNSESCPYSSSSINNDIITFSSSNVNGSSLNMNGSSSNPNSSSPDMNSSSSSSTNMNNNSSCTWSGTVEGKNIRGSMNMTKSDGTYMSYTFTGTETNSKDLGMK